MSDTLITIPRYAPAVEAISLMSLEDEQIEAVNEFLDNGRVYANISEISIQNRHLIIAFDNGLTFDCGKAQGESISIRKSENGLEWKYESQDDTAYQVMFTLDDVRFKFEDLTADELSQLKLHLSDLTEEEIAELQSPAREATDAANQAAQLANQAAESANQAATSANNASASCESIITSEESRQQAEEVRVTAENERVANETTRQQQEEERQTNENQRVTSENERVQQTTSALESVNAAVSNASHLPQIVDGYWQIWNSNTQQYDTTTWPATGKSPKIENSRWYVWNDASQTYEDTGIDVSSDYVLTKEKVESVLTGEIGTHTHYKYVPQIYDAGVDLANLTTYTINDTQQNFELGNVIFIADTNETTGYAPYMLVKTTNGKAWAHVGIIDEGYQMVLVSTSETITNS